MSGVSPVPIRQVIGGDTGRWWHRYDDGRLAVWCGYEYSAVIHEAPVPMAEDPGTFLARQGPNPKRITLALDSRGMDGTEVDEALGVATPADDVVDRWESGDLVPSAEDVRRLATLTGYPTAFFYRLDLEPFDTWTTSRFHHRPAQ